MTPADEASPVAVDAAGVRLMRQILQNERDSLQLSPAQQRLTDLLTLAIYGYVALTAGMALFYGMMAWGAVPCMREWFPLATLVILAIHWIIAIAMIGMFLRNIPYVLSLGARSFRIRRLSLESAVDAPWVVHHVREHLWSLTDLGLRFGALLVFGAVAIDAAAQLVDHYSGVRLILIASIAATPLLVAGAIVMIWVARRVTERIDVLGRLQRNLPDIPPGCLKNTQLEVASTTYRLISQIERAQLARELVINISPAEIAAPHNSYSLQVSQAARRFLATLQAYERHRVQKELDKLLEHLRVPAVSADSAIARDQHSLRVKPWRIDYSIDERAQRVRIKTIKEIDETPGATGA